VTGPGAVRRQVLAAAAVALVALAGSTACTSSGSSSAAPGQSAGASTPDSTSAASGSPQQQSSARFPTASVLLTQCAVSHGVQAVRSSAEQYNASHPKSQEWLTGGKVQLTPANGSGFTDWFENGGGAAVTLGGQQLSDWQQWAASHGELPAQVCGSTVPGAAVRKLYAQVYAHWPSMLSDDPW
jgi:hypothetical protein